MSSDMATQLPASINVVWHHATVTGANREAQSVYCGAIILRLGKFTLLISRGSINQT